MKKQLLMKTFLVAVSLLVGTSAWGLTITYDFKTAAASGGITASSLTKGELAGQNNGTNIYYPTELYSELGNRFAFQYREKSGNTNAWAVDKSRNGLWVNCASGNDDYMSIMSLKEGDKITITIATGKLKFSNVVNVTYDNAGNPATPDAWSEVTSNLEYTVKADGKLDLQAMKYGNGGNAHLAISKIVIVTSSAETMGAPTINATGVNGTKRIVTITPGVGSASSAATATYYTLDESDPTTSGTRIAYTVPFEISETTTIKAVSYLDALAGEVTTGTIEAGTTVQLTAPTIKFAGFVMNGELYNPTYTFSSNQSGIIGTPNTTISYSFDGGASTEASTFTATTAGSITVTVTAAGYESNETVMTIDGGDFIKYYSFNAIDDVTVDTNTGTWENPTNVNSAQWTFTDLANCTYTLREDITLNTFRYARATTAKTKQGFYARLGAGSIGFALNSGEYIVFSMLGGDNIIAKSPATSQSFGQYANVRAIDIYSPAAVTKTITSAGWATYCSPYALDFTGDIANLTNVYIVTGANANSLELSSVKGGTVPANTGLLFEGTAGDVVIPIVGSSETNVDANKLVGVTAETELAANGGYVLMGSPSVGFYQNSNAFTVGANTAYLPADFAATARSFYSFGDATAIKAIDNLRFAIDNYYNVAGQRVAAPTKGLYIKNGKKVVVK